MKGITSVLLAVLLVGASLNFMSCAAAGTVAPIILITNQWFQEGRGAGTDNERRFSLNSLDDCQARGAFTGEERARQANQTRTYDLTGFWHDGFIQMTVNRDGTNVRYTGSYDEDNVKRLRLVSPHETITIILGADAGCTIQR